MKSTVDHKNSILLTVDENELVVQLLGPRCQSLATCVIQLFTTQPPDHSQWFKHDTGIMCFVKDNIRRNYFFRLICLTRRSCVWEQELYNNLRYESPNDFFHNFEADEYMAAFNFASEQEAIDMKRIVLEKITLKRQRREERKSRNSQQIKTLQSRQTPNKPVFQSTPNLSQAIIPNNQPVKKKKRHLTKADISLPKDFKHVSHVGWDPHKGFDIDNVEDPQLKQFFNKAGVSDKQLKDKDTREFIYDFINTHGGLDAVKSEVRGQMLPKKVVSKKTNENNPVPPPVPARAPVNRPAPSPPSVKVRPPPQVRGPPPQRPNNIPRAPEPPPINNAPVPPPPPPISELLSPPPPPMMTTIPDAAPVVPAQNDARSALLESIKAGKTLRPVEQVERKSSVGDSRSDLLSEIRQGIELKPVATTPRTTPPAVTQNSLAAALSDALKNRALAIHSEESESSSEDDEEWDD